MPTFQITAPDGRKFRVTGANAAGALEAVKAHVKQQFDTAFDPSADKPGIAEGIPAAAEYAGNKARAAESPGGGDGLGERVTNAVTFGLSKDAEALAHVAVGGAKSLFTGTPYDMGKEYNKAREGARSRQAVYAHDNPKAAMAADILGTVGSIAATAPAKAVALATETLPQILKAGAKAGATIGGLSGLGEGGGQNPGERLVETLFGAGLGAGVGVAAPLAARGVGAAARTIVQPFRGMRNVDSEAARRAVTALGRDSGGQPERVVRAMEDAQRQGVPLIAADAGETTRAVARSAANTSPEGRAALNAAIDSRFETQTDRAVQLIRDNAPAGARGGEVLEKIQAAKPGVNTPAYNAAYARPVTITKPIQAALETDAGKEAITAAKRLANTEGMPIDPANLDTRALDYVKRGLDDQVSAAIRAGNKEEARALSGLRAKFLAEVDKQNPAYASARKGASTFFGAENALEAGANFVTAKMENRAAEQALAKMTPTERALFAEGFATDLVNQLKEAGRRTSILNSVFVKSPAARERVRLALGDRAAFKLENFLRVENVMDMTRRAMGNSTTARQLAEIGLAGGLGSALGGANPLDPRTYTPKSIIMGLLGAAGRKGLYKIDTNVARRVAEMLASDDPRVIQQAIDEITRNPKLAGALRWIEKLLTNTAAGQAGGQGAKAFNPPQRAQTVPELAVR